MSLRNVTAATVATAVAAVIFVVIGAIAAAAPLAVYLAKGQAAGPILERMRSWIAQHGGL